MDSEDEDVGQVGVLVASGLCLPLRPGVLTLGRAATCDITLQAQGMAQLHAVLCVRDKTTITLLPFTKKITKLNEKLLVPLVNVHLHHGDKLQLGELHATIHFDEEDCDTVMTPVSSAGSDSRPAGACSIVPQSDSESEDEKDLDHQDSGEETDCEDMIPASQPICSSYSQHTLKSVTRTVEKQVLTDCPTSSSPPFYSVDTQLLSLLHAAPTQAPVMPNTSPTKDSESTQELLMSLEPTQAPVSLLSPLSVRATQLMQSLQPTQPPVAVSPPPTSPAASLSPICINTQIVLNDDFKVPTAPSPPYYCDTQDILMDLNPTQAFVKAESSLPTPPSVTPSLPNSPVCLNTQQVLNGSFKIPAAPSPPYYCNTQEIFMDLNSTQVSSKATPALPSIPSPPASPFLPKSPVLLNTQQVLNGSFKISSAPSPPYYCDTQEILMDLNPTPNPAIPPAPSDYPSTQDVLAVNGTTRARPPSPPFYGDTQEVLRDLAPTRVSDTQELLENLNKIPSELNHDTSDTSFKTPFSHAINENESGTKRGILETELPDTPDLEWFLGSAKTVTIEDSDESESEDNGQSTPVVFKRPVPTKRSAPRSPMRVLEEACSPIKVRKIQNNIDSSDKSIVKSELHSPRVFLYEPMSTRWKKRELQGMEVKQAETSKKKLEANTSSDHKQEKSPNLKQRTTSKNKLEAKTSSDPKQEKSPNNQSISSQCKHNESSNVRTTSRSKLNVSTSSKSKQDKSLNQRERTKLETSEPKQEKSLKVKQKSTSKSKLDASTSAETKQAKSLNVKQKSTSQKLDASTSAETTQEKSLNVKQKSTSQKLDASTSAETTQEKSLNVKQKSTSQSKLDASTSAETKQEKYSVKQRATTQNKLEVSASSISDSPLSTRRSHRRPQSAAPPPVVMFSSLESASLEGIVVCLGGSVAERGGTVLVTSRICRTAKFLVSAARGIPIVSPAWVQASNKAGKFLDPKEYILQDRKGEKAYNVRLHQLSEGSGFLEGHCVYISPGVQPPPQQLQDIVEAGGGRAVLLGPRGSVPSAAPPGTFSVSCTADRSLWRLLPAPVCSTEVLLTAALQHRLQLHKHRLQ